MTATGTRNTVLVLLLFVCVGTADAIDASCAKLNAVCGFCDANKSGEPACLETRCCGKGWADWDTGCYLNKTINAKYPTCNHVQSSQVPWIPRACGDVEGLHQRGEKADVIQIVYNAFGGANVETCTHAGTCEICYSAHIN